MFKILSDGNELPDTYHTEMEAYMAMSRLADKANKDGMPLLVAFPVRIEVRDMKNKTICIFRVKNLHHDKEYANRRETSHDMTVEDLLRFCDFENAGKLLKESKPPLDERKELWVPTTSKGIHAYLKLLDLLFSVGKITGTTDEMDEIVRKLDDAAEETVNVDENMKFDYWDELDNAINETDIDNTEDEINDSEMSANTKDELLRYADERRSCLK